jgi:hypothetical protein
LTGVQCEDCNGLGKDEFDDFLGDIVSQAEVGASDRDKAQDDGGRLEDLTAIRPLYPLQLGPAGPQEANRAVAAPLGSARGLLGSGNATAATVAGLAGDLLNLVLAEVALGLRLVLDFVLGKMFWIGSNATVRGRPCAGGVHGHATCATHERGVELVDIARGVVERARHVSTDGGAADRRLFAIGRSSGLGATGCSPKGRGRGVVAPATSATLLCAFTITGHNSAPALASLPMAGVLATPAAVLTQPDAIGVVALALVGLVVAMLALLACEGDRDSNVSAGHV